MQILQGWIPCQRVYACANSFSHCNVNLFSKYNNMTMLQTDLHILPWLKKWIKG